MHMNLFYLFCFIYEVKLYITKYNSIQINIYCVLPVFLTTLNNDFEMCSNETQLL